MKATKVIRRTVIISLFTFGFTIGTADTDNFAQNMKLPIICKKFISQLLVFSILFLMMLTLYACGEKENVRSNIKLGGTYRIPITSEITSLDPASGQYYSWTIGGRIYEGLLNYSKDESKIIGLLADSYEVNGLSYIFYLRQGVKFHDDPCFIGGKGRELTAADVKYSFERRFRIHRDRGRNWGDEEHLGAFAGYEEFVKGKSNQISGFKIINKYTFEIQLKRPDINLLSSLTGSPYYIVPEEAVKYYGEDFKFHPVGTGPFRFSEFLPNDRLVLVKNENYWDFENGVRLPYLDAVKYISYLPGQTEKMLLDFQTGKLDEITDDVAIYLTDLVDSNSLDSIVFKGWLKENGVQFVKDKVFRKLIYLEVFESNIKVRQAISYAINRKRLVAGKQTIFQSYEVAEGPVAPNTIYFNEKLEGQYYAPDKAKELLREAGFPGGKGLPIYPFFSSSDTDAILIVEDLQAVGFKIKKVNRHPGWRKYLEGEGPLLALMRNQTTSPEAYDVFVGFVENTPECLSDTSFVRVFQDWKKNDDTLKNKKLINRLEEITVDITPVVFLYHIGGEFRFLQRYVRGRQLGNAWGYKLNYVWLDN